MSDPAAREALVAEAYTAWPSRRWRLTGEQDDRIREYVIAATHDDYDWADCIEAAVVLGIVAPASPEAEPAPPDAERCAPPPSEDFYSWWNAYEGALERQMTPKEAAHLAWCAAKREALTDEEVDTIFAALACCHADTQYWRDRFRSLAPKFDRSEKRARPVIGERVETREGKYHLAVPAPCRILSAPYYGAVGEVIGQNTGSTYCWLARPITPKHACSAWYREPEIEFLAKEGSDA